MGERSVEMGDLDAIFERLATSAFRRRFRLGPKEQAYLRDKGLETVLVHGRDFVDRRLTPADPVNDGRQTPMRGHPIFIAQHATATCCRSCLAKWHGIPAGREMTAAERDHVSEAHARWLRSQTQLT